MVALTQQERDFVDQFKRFPPDQQRGVMLAMFNTDADRWKKYQAQGEQTDGRRTRFGLGKAGR